MRVVLTPGGKRRLAARLDAVRAEFDAVVADMPAALESGDTSGWHDNFAFEDNQRRQHQLAHRIRDLERVLDSAELIEPWEDTPERVFVGVSVTYRFTDDPADTARRVWIAGFEDGDPAEGRVSYDSPLGRALVGAAEGDERVVRIGEQKRHIEVLELGPTPPGEGARAEEAA
jgi:transcription elongation GreA/GreB family factor